MVFRIWGLILIPFFIIIRMTNVNQHHNGNTCSDWIVNSSKIEREMKTSFLKMFMD